MLDTKLKVLEEAKKLFFHNGIANTRLQQIADAANISVGNLAYHFKNKEAIVEAVYDNLFEELSHILSKYISYTEFEAIDKLFENLYFFYEENGFTFNNIWEIERNHPRIQTQWQALNNKIQQQLKQKIFACLQKKLFKDEQFLGQYNLLASNIQIIVNGWIPQQLLKNKPIKVNTYKKNLWATLFPIFTEQGLLLFNNTIASKNIF